MVFKRRKPLSWAQQAREAVYPASGWRRAVHYIGHRLKRLPDTPHRISLGIACGVFVSFSPLFGFHFIYAALIAMILRGNVLAALLGTFFGNPLTFPLIAAVSFRTGRSILGMSTDHHVMAKLRDDMITGLTGLWHSLLSLVGLEHARWGDVATFFSEVFWPYYVGGIVPGIIAGIVAYLISRPLVTAYQKRRRGFLAKISEKKRRLKHPAQTTDPAE